MEVPMFGRHVGFYAFLHQGLALQTVGNKVFDGDDAQPMFLRHFLQLGHASHGTILVQYFNKG